MKRMNLKKAISLTAFVFVMFFSASSVMAQNENAVEALELKIEAITNELAGNSAVRPQNTEITQKDPGYAEKTMRIAVMTQTLDFLKKNSGAPTLEVVNRFFAKVNDLESIEAKEQLLLIKQEIINTIN